MKREKVELNGQPVGRIKAGWLLFKETLRFLWLDKEMLWVPLISSLINLIFFGLIIGLMVFAVLMNGGELAEDSPLWYVFIFLAYVAGAFTLAFSQATITHIVYVRAHGGDATLGQGLKRALSHWFSLFLWSIITSTVGIILRIISDKSELLGKIVAAFIGAAWGILTYFVVPAMVIDDKSAFSSIKKSGQVFKTTWGETLVSNFSYGFVFMLINLVAMISFVGLFVIALLAEMPILAFFFVVLFVIWLILASLVSSALSGVIRTLLYIYASENTVPENFNRELIEKMLARKNPQPEPVQTNFNNESTI